MPRSEDLAPHKHRRIAIANRDFPLGGKDEILLNDSKRGERRVIIIKIPTKKGDLHYSFC
jgi:hypothetical protein